MLLIFIKDVSQFSEELNEVNNIIYCHGALPVGILIPGNRIRLGLFGSFYPFVDRLSTTTTGLVTLLGMSDKVESLFVFCPTNSSMPAAVEIPKIKLIPSWKYDSVFSLIKTMYEMMKMRGVVDIYVFNIFLTSFGRSKVTNAIGLLIPTLISRLSGKRVCTYLHNSIETQDVEKLGYKDTWFVKKVASRLEWLIARNTLLIVPLKSQASILESMFRTSVRSLAVPYVEGINGFISNSNENMEFGRWERRTFNYLLFGSWGPQKDLNGALKIFKEVLDEGHEIHVIVAGNANSNFPHYTEEIERLIGLFPAPNIEWIKAVPEELVPALFLNSDVLFLPYRAAGGYSAVMNVGAFYGIKIVAYDIPELKEFDSMIKAGCTFVDSQQPDELKRVLISAAQESKIEKLTNTATMRSKLRASLDAVEDLIEMLIQEINPS